MAQNFVAKNFGCKDIRRRSGSRDSISHRVSGLAALRTTFPSPSASVSLIRTGIQVWALAGRVQTSGDGFILNKILRGPSALLFLMLLPVGIASGQQTQTPTPPPPAQQTQPSTATPDNTGQKNTDK